jgi:chromatin remodeling complex protein RSC6
MGLDEDSLVTRAEVMRAINKYIKDNNLQVETDRRNFVPDKSLSKLLDVDGQISYFGVQKYITPLMKKD